MLRGHVRRRVLWATGMITGVSVTVYGGTTTLWMPEVVASHQRQFGFFGVPLALVTWFSGTAICIVVGRAPVRCSRRIRVCSVGGSRGPDPPC